MRRKHRLDHRFIRNPGGAFVMDHHVITRCVIWISVNGKSGLGRGVIHMDLVHDDIRTGFNSFFQNVLLSEIIMAATASNQQSFERLGVSGCDGDETTNKKDRERLDESCHEDTV